MSSVKSKSKKNAPKPKKTRIIPAELSIPGRKSKDRSAHVIGQENFKSAGDYYAFHDTLLKTAVNKRKLKRSEARKNACDEYLKVKSEMEAFAETEMGDELVGDLTSPPTCEVDADVLIPEARPETPVPVLQDRDVDPKQEAKPNESVDNDDFIPISPVVQSIDDSLSELIAIQTILTKLGRKRRLLIKRNKISQPIAAPAQNYISLIKREKKLKAALSTELKSIEIKKEPVSHLSSPDPSNIMSLNYEDNLDFTDYSENDFEFPAEEDFMAYNGSPNDPMLITDASDLVEFTSPSVAGTGPKRQFSSRSKILVQAEFSCTPPFSCVPKAASVPASRPLGALLAIKSEPATDEAAWGSFHESEFEAMHSTLLDTNVDAHVNTSIDDWLNLTTTEVLPDDDL